jgi:hypothetical protein
VASKDATLSETGTAIPYCCTDSICLAVPCAVARFSGSETALLISSS